MTPKEKARELYDKMDWLTGMLSNTEFDDEKIKRTKAAAIVVVDEILLANPTWFVDPMKSTHKFWEDVKKELESF